MVNVVSVAHVEPWFLVVIFIYLFAILVLLLGALKITIRPMFAWYDFWVGLYIDHKRKQLYFFPVPMFGFLVRWNDPGDRHG